MIKNSTIKIESDGYFVAHNEIYRNNEISARAKGLHGFLRSCSADFHISMYELYTFFQEGRDAICRAFRELEDWGYITRQTVQITLDDGRSVRRVDYTVHAISKIASGGLRSKMRHKQREKGKDRKNRKAKRRPESDFQETENQGPENQGPENPCAIRSTTREELPRDKKNYSPTENVEGRDVPSASSLVSPNGDENSHDADGMAFDGRRGKPNRGKGQGCTVNPPDAPWNGRDYSQAFIPEVSGYEDVERISDPIVAAIAVTNDRGFGFWIKVLNYACVDGMPLDMAIRIFRNCVDIIFGQKKAGELTNPAAALNNMLKDAFALKEMTA